MKSLKYLNLLISFSFLSSCGYQWAPLNPEGVRPTVTVPFARGDEEGFLTTQVIHALSESGLFDIVPSGGDYELNMEILGCEIDKIGFRIVPQKVKDKVQNNLRPSEGRKNLTVEVSLTSGKELKYGPYQIVGEAEYDYVDGDSLQDLTFVNASGSRVTVLPFSLGQLEPMDSAEAAAANPLYRKISQKIVDALSSEW